MTHQPSRGVSQTIVHVCSFRCVCGWTKQIGNLSDCCLCKQENRTKWKSIFQKTTAKKKKQTEMVQDSAMYSMRLYAEINACMAARVAAARLQVHFVGIHHYRIILTTL